MQFVFRTHKASKGRLCTKRLASLIRTISVRFRSISHFSIHIRAFTFRSLLTQIHLRSIQVIQLIMHQCQRIYYIKSQTDFNLNLNILLTVTLRGKTLLVFNFQPKSSWFGIKDLIKRSKVHGDQCIVNLFTKPHWLYDYWLYDYC